MSYLVQCPVTVTLDQGSIGLYPPRPARYEEDHDLPWAVLASLPITFRFGSKRSRFKVLKAKVQMGLVQPQGLYLTDAYGSARAMLVSELHQHGVWAVHENSLDLHDCGLSSWGGTVGL